MTAGDIDADLTTARTAYREAQKAYTAYPSPVTRQAMEGGTVLDCQPGSPA